MKNPGNCIIGLKTRGLLRSKKSLQATGLFVLLSLIIPLQAFAESAIQCHCFTERSYNPADRFAADEYILATSFNSLLANAYGLPKRQIVMIKMNEGVGQDDLLVGLKLSRLTGIDIRKFLRLRRQKNSWAKILSSMTKQQVVAEDEILQGVLAGMPVEEAGTRVADEMISNFYRVPGEEVKKLKASGLNEKETALVFILAHISEIPPEALVKQYKEQGRSWSEIAFNIGLEPDETGKRILEYPENKAQQ